jgi:hypothetical protein
MSVDACGLVDSSAAKPALRAHRVGLADIFAAKPALRAHCGGQTDISSPLT